LSLIIVCYFIEPDHALAIGLGISLGLVFILAVVAVNVILRRKQLL